MKMASPHEQVKQLNKQARKTSKPVDWQRNTNTYLRKQANKQTSKQSSKHANKQGKQTNKQTRRRIKYVSRQPSKESNQTRIQATLNTKTFLVSTPARGFYGMYVCMSKPKVLSASQPASQPTKLGPVFFIRKTYLFHRSGGDAGPEVSFKRRVLQQV